MRNENYNLASAVTVSEKSGAISGNQWLPEMPTGKTELKLKRRAATGVAVSTEKGVNLSQDEATEW